MKRSDKTKVHLCDCCVPARCIIRRLGVETPVVETRSSSDDGSITLCLFAGLTRLDVFVAAGASLSHGNVLAIGIGAGKQGGEVQDNRRRIVVAIDEGGGPPVVALQGARVVHLRF